MLGPDTPVPLKKRLAKTGPPPGTLVHVGEERTEKVRITIIAHDKVHSEQDANQAAMPDRRYRVSSGTIIQRLKATWANALNLARRISPSRRFWIIGPVCVILLTVVAVGGYEYYLATSSQPPQVYPALSLDGVHSLLVIAPHCDDETLGAGGLLQAALQRGLRIRVVIATAGDGYLHATEAQFKTLSPGPEDYIRMGEMRQQESVNALARLGVPESNVTFLTYPEHCLAELWWSNWKNEQPNRSPFTQLDHSIYPRAFHPDAPFAGEAMLGDLRTLLASERPDLILIPHPNDAHPDHRALNAFASLAVEMEHQADPTFRPHLLGYLVHYGLYPEPVDLRMKDSLRPPRQLQPIGQWIQWWLSSEEEATKLQAVRSYPSQDRVLGYFLYSFVRRNELFVEVNPVASVTITQTQSFSEAAGQPNSGFTGSTEYTPVSDSIFRQIDSGADIIGLSVMRQDNALWITTDVRGDVSTVYSYTLYIRAFASQGSTTWTSHWGKTRSKGVQASGRTISYPLDLNALGQPAWLAFYADTRREAILDSTAWYLVYLGSETQDQ
jgi:LmbE family N-acetylglucosaminyl deacetylase